MKRIFVVMLFFVLCTPALAGQVVKRGPVTKSASEKTACVHISDSSTSAFVSCPLKTQYEDTLGVDGNERTHCHVPKGDTFYFTRLRTTVVDDLANNTEECRVRLAYNNTFSDDSHTSTSVVDSSGCSADAVIELTDYTTATSAIAHQSIDLCASEGVTGFWSFKTDDQVSGQLNANCTAADDPHECCTGSGTGECEAADVDCSALTSVEVCVDYTVDR